MSFKYQIVRDFWLEHIQFANIQLYSSIYIQNLTFSCTFAICFIFPVASLKFAVLNLSLSLAPLIVRKVNPRFLIHKLSGGPASKVKESTALFCSSFFLHILWSGELDFLHFCEILSFAALRYYCEEPLISTQDICLFTTIVAWFSMLIARKICLWEEK